MGRNLRDRVFLYGLSIIGLTLFIFLALGNGRFLQSSPLPGVWVFSFLFLAMVAVAWMGSRWVSGATEDTTQAPVAPESPSRAAEKDLNDPRAVYVPGRNYGELLDRLEGPEALLDTVLRSMSECVILLNASGRVVLANPAAQSVLEVRETDLLGKHFLEVVRHAGLADLITRSQESDGVTQGELEFGGGQERTFSANVGALREADGHVLGQIVVFSDVTGLKRLMKMRSEFVANVSHELKTPLTAILGYVETLQAGGMDDKKNRSAFLGKISDQSKRLHALIEDVLELSRIEAGKTVGAAEPVLLLEAVEQAVETLRAKAEARHITVHTEGLEGRKVRGQADSVLRILVNLLDNAIKFSPDGSIVGMGIRVEGSGRLAIWVKDEGPGIPKEHLPRLFERFYRVDVSRSRSAGGTGLGLSIVKHLAERMGGEVKVESIEGKGSVFSVILNSI